MIMSLIIQSYRLHEAQLKQRDRATLRVIEYFASHSRSLKVIRIKTKSITTTEYDGQLLVVFVCKTFHTRQGSFSDFSRFIRASL